MLENIKKASTAAVIGLTHNKDGSFSSTKVWQGVGYAVAGYIMLHLTWGDRMSVEYFATYIGMVTAARSYQNYLQARGKSTE